MIEVAQTMESQDVLAPGVRVTVCKGPLQGLKGTVMSLEQPEFLLVTGDDWQPGAYFRLALNMVACDELYSSQRKEEEMSKKGVPQASEPQLDEIIRTSAYYKWDQTGRPPGDGLQFWLEAEKDYAAHNGQPQVRPDTAEKEAELAVSPT